MPPPSSSPPPRSRQSARRATTTLLFRIRVGTRTSSTFNRCRRRRHHIYPEPRTPPMLPSLLHQPTSDLIRSAAPFTRSNTGEVRPRSPHHAHITVPERHAPPRSRPRPHWRLAMDTPSVVTSTSIALAHLQKRSSCTFPWPTVWATPFKSRLWHRDRLKLCHVPRLSLAHRRPTRRPAKTSTPSIDPHSGHAMRIIFPVTSFDRATSSTTAFTTPSVAFFLAALPHQLAATDPPLLKPAIDALHV